MGASNSKVMLKNEERKIVQAKVLTNRQMKTISNQISKSLCQIATKEGIATGFLCCIPNPVLITSNHVLEESQIEPDKEIDIYFNDENGNKYHKKIKIDDTRTTYSVGWLNGEEVDTTIIELKPEIDGLNEQKFMKIDSDLMSEKLEKSYE